MTTELGSPDTDEIAVTRPIPHGNYIYTTINNTTEDLYEINKEDGSINATKTIVTNPNGETYFGGTFNGYNGLGYNDIIGDGPIMSKGGKLLFSQRSYHGSPAVWRSDIVMLENEVLDG